MRKPPDIVVVICHDMGQHLGCYGQADVRSVHIDAFAASGFRFNRSFCTAPQCSPSRAALYTGRFPHANGVVGLTHAGFANDLNEDEQHLAQMLRDTGYETHLFGVMHESRSAQRCGYEHIHAGGVCGKVADDFVEFLSQRSESVDRPLFAQIGFFEPHRPFPHDDVEPLSQDMLTIPPYLPDIPEVREDLADIEASIVSADKAFGKIVGAIRTSNIAENTLILFTADHGIAFPHAKMTLYDAGIEVPLILSAPDIPSGVVRPEMISNVDVVPTLLDYVGLPVPGNLHGRSFCNLLMNQPYQPNEAVYAEKTYHTYYDPMRAIRTEQWKLIANFENAPYQETSPDYMFNAKSYVEVSNAIDMPMGQQYHPPYELFDVLQDPYELNNLADDATYREIRDALIQKLYTWMEETSDPLLDGPMEQGAYRIRMTDFQHIGQR